VVLDRALGEVELLGYLAVGHASSDPIAATPSRLVRTTGCAPTGGRRFDVGLGYAPYSRGAQGKRKSRA